MTYFSSRRRTRIDPEIGNWHRAVGLHWFLDLRANVWQMRLHVYTRLVVTLVWIEKPCNEIIEVGFMSTVFHLCQRALVPLLRNYRGPNAAASIWLGKTGKALLITYVFSNLTFKFRVLLDVIRGRRSLGYWVSVVRSHFISIWTVWAIDIRVTDIYFVTKDHSLSLQWMRSLPVRMGNTTPETRRPCHNPFKCLSLIWTYDNQSQGTRSNKIIQFWHPKKM